MRARLSSHRFRRRLAWTTGATGIVALVVGMAVHVGNTGEKFDTPLSNKNAWVYTEPKLHRLSSRERLALFSTSSHFVQTAVARRNLGDAWDLLAPEMQSGQTRKSWLSGSNNVVPFPVRGIAAWDILYSYDNDVALDMMLVAKPGGDIVGKSFTIELKRYPQRGNRWLVASWVPKGITSERQSKAAAAAPPPPPAQAPLGSVWLLVPLSVLAMIVLIPLAVALRTARQHRRAAKQYARDLADYSSSSSPS
jgi:hypothetical protein